MAASATVQDIKGVVCEGHSKTELKGAWDGDLSACMPPLNQHEDSTKRTHLRATSPTSIIDPLEGFDWVNTYAVPTSVAIRDSQAKPSTTQ